MTEDIKLNKWFEMTKKYESDKNHVFCNHEIKLN